MLREFSGGFRYLNQKSLGNLKVLKVLREFSGGFRYLDQKSLGNLKVLKVLREFSDRFQIFGSEVSWKSQSAQSAQRIL